MLDELEIWQKIFVEKDIEKLEYLIRMVVSNECTREYVLDKIIELRNRPRQKFEININLDESLKDYPVEILADEIAKDIIDNIKKDIKTIS